MFINIFQSFFHNDILYENDGVENENQRYNIKIFEKIDTCSYVKE